MKRKGRKNSPRPRLISLSFKFFFLVFREGGRETWTNTRTRTTHLDFCIPRSDPGPEPGNYTTVLLALALALALAQRGHRRKIKQIFFSSIKAKIFIAATPARGEEQEKKCDSTRLDLDSIRSDTLRYVTTPNTELTEKIKNPHIREGRVYLDSPRGHI